MLLEICIGSLKQQKAQDHIAILTLAKIESMDEAYRQRKGARLEAPDFEHSFICRDLDTLQANGYAVLAHHEISILALICIRPEGFISLSL